jgi:tetratricopeptide (TPR) repeat protein
MRSRSFCFLLLVGAAWAACPLHSRAHGDLHDAIVEASRRIAESPADAALYFQRAEFYRLHEEYGAAETDYRRVRELDPTLSSPLLGLAQVRLAAERPAESLPFFDEFLKAHPTHARALYLRAQALAQTGAWERADADLAAAIAVAQPPPIELFLRRADGLVQHGRQAEAVRCLEEGSAKLGGRSPTLEQRALEIEEASGDPASALRRLDSFIAAGFRPDRWLARKARLLEKLDRRAEAAATWDAAMKSLDAALLKKQPLPPDRKLVEEIHAALSRLAPSPSPVETKQP